MLYSCCMGSSDEEDFITESVVIADSASTMPWLTRSGFWSLPQFLFSLLTSLRAFRELKVLLRWCGRQSSTPWCTWTSNPQMHHWSSQAKSTLKVSLKCQNCSNSVSLAVDENTESEIFLNCKADISIVIKLWKNVSKTFLRKLQHKMCKRLVELSWWNLSQLSLYLFFTLTLMYSSYSQVMFSHTLASTVLSVIF